MLPASVQNPVCGENSLLMSNAVLPALAVSVMFGSRLAIATPTSALAECTLASAARTSGRCRTRADGRLTGTSRGRCSIASSNRSLTSWLGKRPARAVSRCRCCCSCRCSGGSVCSICASAASCCTTSASAICQIPRDGDDLLRGGNLAAQGRFLHRREHDIRGQGEVGGFELKCLALLLRLQRFDRAPVGAKHVR